MISETSSSDCKERGMFLKLEGDVIAKRWGCFSKNIRMFLKLEGDVIAKRWGCLWKKIGMFSEKAPHLLENGD